MHRGFDAALSVGVHTVIDPFVPPERWRTAVDVAAVAERPSAVADAAGARGSRVGYHNPAHELESRIDGVTALAKFAGMPDDSVVLQVDTYSSLVGGVDAAAPLPRPGARVVVH